MIEFDVQNTLERIFERLRSIDEKVTVTATRLEDISARRLPNLEDDVEALKAHKNKAMGYAGGIAAVVTTFVIAVRVVVEYLWRNAGGK